MDHHPRTRTMRREFKAVIMDRNWKPDLNRPETKKKENDDGAPHYQES